MSIKNIFSKLFISSDDKAEYDEMHNWAEESKNNIKGINDFITMENVDWESVKNYQTVDTQKAWNKVNASIGNPEKSTMNVYRKYAASIAIVLGCLSLLYWKGLSTADTKQYAANTITKYELRDGSVIDLDKGSVVEEITARQVRLQGRAYFDIKPNPEQPFTITLRHGIVTVLGTEFTIQTTEESTMIYVTEGKVAYNFGGKTYFLAVNDYCTIQNGVVTIKTIPNAGLENWRNNQIVFVNASMQTILTQIGLEHNIKVTNQKGWAKDNCKINTKFDKENLDQILKELTIIAGLQYTKTSSAIIVTDYKCE